MLSFPCYLRLFKILIAIANYTCFVSSFSSKVITQDEILKRRKLPSSQITELKRGMIQKETALDLCGRAPTLIKIMEKFDMLVPCQLEEDQDKFMYLVPCLLPRVRHQKAQEDETFPKIHFKLTPKTVYDRSSLERSGFLPHGLFHRVVSSCCRVRKWKHHQSMIFYDYIAIELDNFFFSLRMVYNGITLSAFNFKGEAEEHTAELGKTRKQIQSIIEEITKEIFPNLVCMPYLECNCLLSAESRNKLR